jgi:hypothetical protein
MALRNVELPRSVNRFEPGDEFDRRTDLLQIMLIDGTRLYVEWYEGHGSENWRVAEGLEPQVLIDARRGANGYWAVTPQFSTVGAKLQLTLRAKGKTVSGRFYTLWAILDITPVTRQDDTGPEEIEGLADVTPRAIPA